MKKRKQSHAVVDAFVRYQQTGHDFALAWGGLEPIVREFATRHLEKMGVTAYRRRTGRIGHEDGHGPFVADDSATDDVVHDTALVLIQLADANAKGRFDRSKAKPGISGLRGWLWRVVGSQSVNWVREHRGRRGVAIRNETSLEQLFSFDSAEPGSFFQRLAAKPERQALLPIIEACIVQLPDAFHRQILLRKLHEELSIRKTARAMSVPSSRVQRHLVQALASLKQLVEHHDIDENRLEA